MALIIAMVGYDVLNAPANAATAHIESFLGWWALAGMDCVATEEPVNWLQPANSAGRDAAAPNDVARPFSGFPTNLTAFHDYLACAPDLPESRWPGSRVLPTGPQNARLMILVHAPNAAAQPPGVAFGPDEMRLLAGMTRSIGIDLEQCYVGSLSLVSPAGGVIDPETMEKLVVRMRHHIALVAPQRLLVMGDQAGRALLSTNEDANPENLPFVDHRDGIVQAISVIHPRLMVGQPSAKAEAWRSLQRLARGWDQ